jgi:hypothetical protein
MKFRLTAFRRADRRSESLRRSVDCDAGKSVGGEAKSGEIRFKRFWLNRMNAWWLGCAWQNNRFVERLTLHCFDFKMFFFFHFLRYL